MEFAIDRKVYKGTIRNKSMDTKQRIQKMHKETCVAELKKASRLSGDETASELDIILERTECIQASILLNGFNRK